MLPVHIFGYPADLPAFEAHRACRSSRTPARRSARSTRTASPVGGRGHPAVFGFYANKQLTTGEGGIVTLGDAAREGAHRLRAQPGPRAGHGLARPRPARLQLPPVPTSPARSASPSSSGSTACSPPARASPRWYREALGRDRGPRRCPCPDAGGDVRGWFVFVVQLPRGVDRDDDGPRAARARRPEQALPARDPPDELLPRALRPPRGRVPGLRGRRRALARAAVLPGDDRGAGRARRDGACDGVARPDVNSRPACPAARRARLARRVRGRGGAAGRCSGTDVDRRRSPAEFRLDAGLPLTGWTCWALHGPRPRLPRPAGGRGVGATPSRRFHRRGTGAWYGWGVTLYLLGFALATQVAQIADGLSAV